MALSDIVSVTISTSAPGITQVGFGVPIIVGYHTHFSERVRFYTSLTGMTDDGFVTTDPFYKAAAALQAQSPAVTRWAVGRCALAPTQTVDLTPTSSNSKTYGVTIGTDGAVAVRFAITADSSTSVSEITAALATAITGVTGITDTDNTTKLTLAGTSGKWFSVEVDDNSGNANGMGLWTVKDVTADPGIATDLGAILTENSDWYGIILTHRSEAIINAAAAWVESNKKFMVCATQDTDAKTSSTTDILSDLETASYARTAGMYHHKPHQFPDAAWMGNRFPYAPGSNSWAYCTLSGVDVSVLTASERGYIEGKHANFYVTEGGVGVTFFGWTGANEWIDTTIFIDWLTSELQGGCVQLLIDAASSGRKIPFTDAGIAQVESVVRARLDSGVKVGGLAADPEPVITVPAAADVSSANKAARNLPSVAFSATLAGAIHKLAISGVVTN